MQDNSSIDVSHFNIPQNGSHEREPGYAAGCAGAPRLARAFLFSEEPSDPGDFPQGRIHRRTPFSATVRHPPTGKILYVLLTIQTISSPGIS